MLVISIDAVFLDEQSIPEESIYIWAYHVKIINKYKEDIRIVYRNFEVVDAIGQKQIVDGVGIANKTVLIKQGKIFEYASGMLLSNACGILNGSYTVELQNGELKKHEIPAISLDSPYKIVRLQ